MHYSSLRSTTWLLQSTYLPHGELVEPRMVDIAKRRLFRRAGLQGEGVQYAAHVAFQRIVDHLVLLNT